MAMKERKGYDIVALEHGLHRGGKLESQRPTPFIFSKTFSKAIKRVVSIS